MYTKTTSTTTTTTTTRDRGDRYGPIELAQLVQISRRGVAKPQARCGWAGERAYRSVYRQLQQQLCWFQRILGLTIALQRARIALSR